MRARVFLTASTTLLLATVGNAQNLIPNWSFEEFTSNCDFGIGYDNLENWGYIPCTIPPGVVNACTNPLGSGVPQSSLGYQYAHSGDGFIRIWTLRMNSTDFPDGNPQMYANVDLTQPLVAGQHYCMRLWVNMADSSCYRTGALHAFLWYGEPTVCNYQDTAWDTYAAITWDISAVDTANWTLLEGEFDANGGEANLTIGAFQFMEEIDSVFIADHPNLFLGTRLAIYFIDDVELWACQVGLDEFAPPDDVNIYPNPAADGVTVELSGTVANTTVELLSADGRLVMQTTITSVRAQLDVSHIANGGYRLRVRSGDGVFVKPLVISR